MSAFPSPSGAKRTWNDDASDASEAGDATDAADATGDAVEAAAMEAGLDTGIGFAEGGGFSGDCGVGPAIRRAVRLDPALLATSVPRTGGSGSTSSTR